MSAIPARKDDILKDDKIIDFNEQREARKGLITGGPTGPENWLGNTVPGTFFLARPKADNSPIPLLNKFLIIEHKTVSSNLVWWSPDGSKEMNIWVPTLEFSRKFVLAETIGYIDLGHMKEEQSETTDGNCDRTVQPRGLVHDESSVPGSEVHASEGSDEVRSGDQVD